MLSDWHWLPSLTSGMDLWHTWPFRAFKSPLPENRMPEGGINYPNWVPLEMGPTPEVKMVLLASEDLGSLGFPDLGLCSVREGRLSRKLISQTEIYAVQIWSLELP